MDKEDIQQADITFLQSVIDWLMAAMRWVKREQRKIEDEQASGVPKKNDWRM